jgi:hypothetical protein
MEKIEKARSANDAHEKLAQNRRDPEAATD